MPLKIEHKIQKDIITNINSSTAHKFKDREVTQCVPQDGWVKTVGHKYNGVSFSPKQKWSLIHGPTSSTLESIPGEARLRWVHLRRETKLRKGYRGAEGWKGTVYACAASMEDDGNVLSAHVQPPRRRMEMFRRPLAAGGGRHWRYTWMAMNHTPAKG